MKIKTSRIRKKHFLLAYAFVSVLFVFSCEKNIQVELPDQEPKLVVEGWIEQDLPPFIVLTKSVAFFEPTDLTAFENSFVHDAHIEINDGSNNFVLQEFCSKDFTPEQLEQISALTGINPVALQNVNYCVYTSLTLLGVVGKNYSLKIKSEGNEYTSITQIPYLVNLDSVWFRIDKGQEAKGLGFAYAFLNDPDTLGNGYRWEAKRLGKDENFKIPFGASSTDILFNGKGFEFGYNRPVDEEDQTNKEEASYYKVGDSIVIKFSTIDKAHYDFLSTYESFLITNGNPFASPSSIKSNIRGNALGVWGGYGVTYDTIIAR